jgi:hypothetical protein
LKAVADGALAPGPAWADGRKSPKVNAISSKTSIFFISLAIKMKRSENRNNSPLFLSLPGNMILSGLGNKRKNVADYSGDRGYFIRLFFE